ncbi:MAG: hypothetical protein KAT07_01155 [Calditrichia bacterium]|nr:hypothetical protein [Calditrichia bacterium]
MVRIIFIILMWGFIFQIHAEGNGGYSGAFLRIGLGARGIAMGNAQVATADHGFGFYYNPAAQPYLEKFSANFSYSFLSLDRRFSFVGLSSPLKPQGGLSLGWIYSGVKDIQGYDSRGFATDNINHGIHAIYFSFGIFVVPQRLSVGINAKYLREDLSDPDFDYDGSGFGMDLGILAKVTRDLSVGYLVKDLNASLQSNTNNIFERGIEKDNKFPITHRLGLFYDAPVRWIHAAYDFEWSHAGEVKNHLGLEFTVPGVAARIGYDTDHFTFGGGLEIDRFTRVKAILDYAFVTSVIDEGVSHVFSWQLAF